MNEVQYRSSGPTRATCAARYCLWFTLLIALSHAAPVRAQANEEEYRRVVSMGLAALENRRLDEGIAAFKRCLELKPKDADCAYNLACGYSLKRDTRTALDWLSRSIEWGYDDLDHMEKDADLNNLRGEPRYLSLVARLSNDPDPIVDDAKEVQRTTELIVMLDGNLDSAPTIGAGIIFGRQGDQIFIATANHNVRRGAVAATDLRIKLKSMPDQPLAARLTEHFDRDLDLAVLVAALPRARAASFCSTTPFEVLADTADVKRGDAVFPVGYPNGAPWAMPVAPDRIAQLVGNEISFQSAFISGGHSGGGMVTEQGRLIGMIKADKQPFGVALNVTRVLQAVRAWGYPVHLRVSSNFLKTPMHQAIETRDLAELRKLAESCAYVNTMDDEGRTPLHLAASLGFPDVVRVLLESSVDISVRTRGSPNSADAHAFTALHLAALRGSAPVAELLIAQGADVNAQALDFNNRTWGGTPLHQAAISGAVDVIEVLLRARADINATSTDGPPITVGVRRRQLAAVSLLITRGANLNPDGGSDVPLFVAVDSGAVAIVRVLLAGGAKPDHVWVTMTPLHLAARRGHVEIARLLIGARVNINAKTSSGVTPLHEAAGEGRLELVKLLLDSGALPSERETGGGTPLDWALRAGHQEIVTVLRNRR